MCIQVESVQVWVYTGDRQEWLDPGDHRFILTIPPVPLYEQSKCAGTITEKGNGLSF